MTAHLLVPLSVWQNKKQLWTEELYLHAEHTISSTVTPKQRHHHITIIKVCDQEFP